MRFRSSVSLCCPLLVVGIIYFLSTPQGIAFNERTFGRLYTLGALLMIGAYGAVIIGLLALGTFLALTARRKNESPSWIPTLALVLNAGLPIGFFLYTSYS